MYDARKPRDKYRETRGGGIMRYVVVLIFLLAITALAVALNYSYDDRGLALYVFATLTFILAISNKGEG